MNQDLPKLYDALADWWQLVSPTSDYKEEAEFFAKLFKESDVKTILELGAGGGNIAWFLKKDFEMTITDLSQGMLDMSKKQNPECEHVTGDMRTIKIVKTFDGVFIHDAIMYMTNEEDLLAAFNNAALHLKSGGILIVAPDCTRENFKEVTEYEGRDDPVTGRAIRYMHWSSDPNPDDTEFDYDFVIALKENGELRIEIDRQKCGIFPRQTWLDLLMKAGFEPRIVPDTSTSGEVIERVEIFVAKKL